MSPSSHFWSETRLFANVLLSEQKGWRKRDDSIKVLLRCNLFVNKKVDKKNKQKTLFFCFKIFWHQLIQKRSTHQEKWYVFVIISDQIHPICFFIVKNTSNRIRSWKMAAQKNLRNVEVKFFIPYLVFWMTLFVPRGWRMITLGDWEKNSERKITYNKLNQ